jgi:hypothetical protein
MSGRRTVEEDPDGSARKVTGNDSGIEFSESLRRSARSETGQTRQQRLATESVQSPRERSMGPPRRRRREDDQVILSAILTLLPELNVESLKVVIGSCIELSK